jgi:hypothetical protein
MTEVLVVKDEAKRAEEALPVTLNIRYYTSKEYTDFTPEQRVQLHQVREARDPNRQVGALVNSTLLTARQNTPLGVLLVSILQLKTPKHFSLTMVHPHSSYQQEDYRIDSILSCSITFKQDSGVL